MMMRGCGYDSCCSSLNEGWRWWRRAERRIGGERLLV
jgi:hypothetical protein